MLKFITRFLIALTFGVIISIWIVQNNAHVQKSMITTLLTFLEKEWNSTITVESHKTNFFICSVFLNKGKVSCLNRTCAWQFNEAKIQISLLDLIFNKKISLYLTFNNVHATTQYKNAQFDVVDHITDIFKTKSGTVTVNPELIRINNMHVTTRLFDKNIQAHVPGHFEMKKQADTAGWTGTLSFNDGSVAVNELALLTHLAGSINFNKTGENRPWTITIDNQLQYAGLAKDNSFNVTGRWDYHAHKIVINNPKKLLDLVVAKSKYDLNVKGTANLALIINLHNNLQDPPPPLVLPQLHQTLSPLDGTTDIDLAIDPMANTSGTITLNNLQYKKLALGTCNLKNIVVNDNALKTNLVWQLSPHTKFTGKIDWDKKLDEGKLLLTNATSLSPFMHQQKKETYESWIIQPHDFVMKTTITKNDGYKGNYKMFLTNHLSDGLVSFKGDCSITPERLKIQGTTEDGNYKLEAHLNPEPYISKIQYTEDNKKLIDLNITHKNSKAIAGLIHYSLIQSFLSHNFKRLILGRKNILHVALDQTNFENISGSIKLLQGKFYIPESRNLIENLATDFNFYPASKKFTLSNAHLDFCKGSLHCPQAVFFFDDAYALKQMHAPLEINNLFINWKRDFYGFIYGNILFTKIPTKHAEIIGNIILKKSLLRDNIFSTEISNNFYSPSSFLDQNIGINIRLSSEKPIKVKTSSLETYAHVDVKVKYLHNKKSVQIPYIDGTITLDGGALSFFRNKLFIEYGRIQFVANQMNDPLIDLTARNTINKYVVTLQTTGSLQKPNIILESTPDLSEEQILGLLLAGSENATLQTDLPVMLMQNLNNIILGSKKILPGSTTFFEKISRPLKYVQITPDFTDQSGRGGIKGILSIDLSKQIHAQIQKNFNLQEDFAFQIEYLLSDDINFKVVKDQRGELGSEVEIKFKL